MVKMILEIEKVPAFASNTMHQNQDLERRGIISREKILDDKITHQYRINNQRAMSYMQCRAKMYTRR